MKNFFNEIWVNVYNIVYNKFLKKIYYFIMKIYTYIIIFISLLFLMICYICIEIYSNLSLDYNWWDIFIKILLNDNIIIIAEDIFKKKEIDIPKINIYNYIIKNYMNNGWDYVFISQNDVSFFSKNLYQIDINLIYDYLINIIIEFINILLYFINKIYISFILENKYFHNFIIKKDFFLWRKNQIYNKELYINNLIELFSEGYKIKLNIIEKKLINKDYIIVDGYKWRNNKKLVNNYLLSKYKSIHSISKKLFFFSKEINLVYSWIYKNINSIHKNVLYSSTLNLYYNYYCIWKWFIEFNLIENSDINFKLNMTNIFIDKLNIIDILNKFKLYNKNSELPILRTIQRREGWDIWENGNRYQRRHWRKIVHRLWNKRVDTYYNSLISIINIKKQPQSHPLDVIEKSIINIFFKIATPIFRPLNYVFNIKDWWYFLVDFYNRTPDEGYLKYLQKYANFINKELVYNINYNEYVKRNQIYYYDYNSIGKKFYIKKNFNIKQKINIDNIIKKLENLQSAKYIKINENFFKKHETYFNTDFLAFIDYWKTRNTYLIYPGIKNIMQYWFFSPEYPTVKKIVNQWIYSPKSLKESEYTKYFLSDNYKTIGHRLAYLQSDNFLYSKKLNITKMSASEIKQVELIVTPVKWLMYTWNLASKYGLVWKTNFEVPIYIDETRQFYTDITKDDFKLLFPMVIWLPDSIWIFENQNVLRSFNITATQKDLLNFNLIKSRPWINHFKSTRSWMNKPLILDIYGMGLKKYYKYTNIYNNINIIQYYQDNIDFNILEKKYYVEKLNIKNYKKLINITLKKRLQYIIHKEFYENLKIKHNFYNRWKKGTKDIKVGVLQEKYLYNNITSKFIFKKVKKDYKVIFLFFNSLYYDLNINEFKLNKEFIYSLTNNNKNNFVKQINIDINKNLLNYDIYTKINKKKLVSVEKLLIKEDGIGARRVGWWSKNNSWKAWSKDIYKKYVWYWTKASPRRSGKTLHPKLWRVWLFENRFIYDINLEQFYKNSDYLYNNLKYYKNAFTNILYYIINPKLKVYEINNNRYKYYPIYLFENKENISMYGKIKNLKFFGGYTYWYEYFQDYNIFDEYNNLNLKNTKYAYSKNKNIELYNIWETWEKYIGFPTWYKRRIYSIGGRFLYTVYALHGKYAGFINNKNKIFENYVFINEYKTNYLITQKMKKYFSTSLLSDDIWDLKKVKIKYLPKKLYNYYYNIELIKKFKFYKLIKRFSHIPWQHKKIFFKRYMKGITWKQKPFPFLSRHFPIRRILRAYKFKYFNDVNIINTQLNKLFLKEKHKYYWEIMDKINSSNYVKIKKTLKYFILEYKTNLWIKDILIRRPKLKAFFLDYPRIRDYRDYKSYIYDVNKDVFKVPSYERKRDMHRIFTRTWAPYEITSTKVWLKWFERFNKYFTAKNPVVLRVFAHGKNRWTEAQVGWLDINHSKIMKISKKAKYLLEFTQKYNKQRIERLKYFWVKEFSKDFIYGNKLKYFILEKLKANKILVKEKHLFIKNNNNTILNILLKKYYFIINKLNKDNIFYLSQIKDKKIEYNYNKKNYQNVYYWERNYYKKNIFYKKFFWEKYYNNIHFDKLNAYQKVKFYEHETLWDLEKEETLNFYYKIHFVSLNLNILKHINNFNKINWKNEYFNVLLNMYKNEETEYELYFLLKNRKKILLNNVKNIIKVINNIIIFIYKPIKYIWEIIFNKYVLIIIILILLLLLYLSLIFFIIILIKSSKPLNNIYGIKSTLNKKKKNKKIYGYKNIINIKDTDLKNILEEDITFGTEQQYIYSLEDKKNPWAKIKLYNKYTQEVKKKINKNYNVLYKNFIFEENLKKIENNTKLKLDFKNYIYFWEFLKNNIEKIQYLKIIQKFFNDRFYNYGRTVKVEHKILNSEDLPHVIKMPQSVIWKRTTFFLKIILGAAIIWIKYIIRYVALRLSREFYFKNFRTELIVKKKSWFDMASEFKTFFKKLKEKKKLKWYNKKMEFISLEDPFKKEEIDLDLDIKGFELDDTYNLYMDIFNYLISKMETYTDDDAPLLEFINENIEKRKEIQEQYIDHLYDIYKNIEENKIEISDWEYDDTLQILQLELYYIDFIIFDFLLKLNIIEDKILKEKLKKEIEIKMFFKKTKEIDWKNKNINLYKLKIEKFIKGKDFRIINKELTNYADKNNVLYIIYRYFTTLGGRFYYLWSLIITLNVIWVNSLYKFKRDNFNISSLIKILIIDIQKFVIKTYWEYILLQDNLKLVENRNKKIKFLKDVIIFSLIIISPLSIYILLLVIIYIIYYYIYLIYIKIYKLKEKMAIKTYLKYEKEIIKLKKIKNMISFIIFCFTFWFKDLKTGDTIFTSIYVSIYTRLGDLQLNIHNMKKVYKNGGMITVLKWIKVKFQIYITEKKLVKKKKINWNEKINNLQVKKAIIIILIQNNNNIKELKLFIKKFIKEIIYIILSKYMIIYLDKITYNFFYLNIKLYLEKNIHYYIKNLNIYLEAFWISYIKKPYIYYKDMYKSLNNNLQKVVFWLQIILLTILLPLIILFKIYKWLMLKYYDIPWHKKKWRLKYSLNRWIDKTLRNSKISSRLYYRKLRNVEWKLESYLAKKAKYENNLHKVRLHLEKEVHWNFGYRQMKPIFVFWSKIAWWKWYKYFMNFKYQQWEYWIYIVSELEDFYGVYTRKLGTKHKSPISHLIKVRRSLRRLKRKTNKFEIKVKEVSRDKFLKRKWKDRRIILRRYFIKGLINWISYILIKKVIFTKIKELKKQKILLKIWKHKKYKYRVPKNVNIAIYITSNLERVKPQLWLLIILYEYYYKGMMQSILAKEKAIFHKTPEAPRNLKVKWKINPHFGEFDLAEMFILSRAKSSPLVKGQYLRSFTKRKPDNILFYYILYIIEALSGEGWSKKKIWHDVSNKFALTYDSKEDNLKYEGKQILTLDPDIIERVARYESFSPLLLKRFDEERRAKTAFIFKLASDATIFNTIRNTEKGIDELEIEKKESFDYFWYDYNSTWGYEKQHLDLKSDWELSWDNDKYLIHYLTIDEIHNECESNYDKEEYYLKGQLKDLFDFVSIIFYDICLVEMINSLNIYINFKKKELLYIEAINIYVEPSLNIPINFMHYYREDYGNAMGNIIVDPHINYLFQKQDIHLERRKIITFDRQIDEEDVLVKFEDVYKKFWSTGGRTMIEEDTYESGRSRELFELKYKYKFEEALIQIIMEELDIIYTWQMILSDRFYEIDEEFNNQILIENIQFMENKWGRNEVWWIDLEKKRKNLNDPILYINIMKLSLIQWLHMDIIEKEKLKLYRSNTILFNERYNIYYIDLLPIRVKLPIKLEMDFKETLYMLEKLVEPSSIDKGILLHPWWLLGPFAKYLVLWQSLKNHFKESYNRSLHDIFYANVDKSESDKETIRLAKKYKEYYTALRYIGLYNYFVADLVTIMRIGWDWVLYHKQWSEIEEFTHADWFLMRLKRQFRDGMDMRAQLDYYPWTLYIIFNPRSFVSIYWGFWKYVLIKYAGIICLTWGFYNIMYCPGEFFVNFYYILVPIWFGSYFMYIWFYIRKYVKEIPKSPELYLYKYQAAKNIELNSRVELFKLTVEEREVLENEVGKGNGHEGHIWKGNRLAYIKSNYNTFYTENAMPVLLMGWWMKRIWWEKWRYRKYSGWDYRRKDLNRAENRFGKFSNSYTRKFSKNDVFTRLEKGSNLYNHWYVHIFRKNKGLERWIIDKALYKKERERFDFLYFFNKRYAVSIKMDISDLCYYYYSMKTHYTVAKLQWKKRASTRNQYDPDDFVGVYRYQKGWGNLKRFENKFDTQDARMKRALRDILGYKKKYINWSEYYELIEPHSEFIAATKEKTQKLIIRDRNEYYANNSKVLFAEKIYLIKKNAYNNLEPIPFKYLIKMSIHEKHINIMWYNLMKYKYYRHFSLYYKNFEQAKQHLQWILNYSNKETILKINIFYNKIDWGKFLWKLYKLKYYIINFNKLSFLQNKKLQLIIEVITQKLKNNPNLYETICKFVKIIYPTWEEIYNIIILIIKLLI